MKTPIFLVLISALVFKFSISQVGSMFMSNEEAQAFRSTELKVVLTGTKEFDEELKKGFENQWEHMDYEFVGDDFEKDLSNESHSFFVPIIKAVGPAPNTLEKDTTYYHKYVLMKGGKEALSDYKSSDFIAEGRISEKGVGIEKSYADVAYRAEHMVGMVSDYVSFKLEDKLPTKLSKYRSTVCSLYSENSNEVLNYTLLIDKSSLGDFDPGYLNKKYPGKIEFVSHDEYVETVKDRNDNYCYFLPLHISSISYFFIVNAGTGEVMYATYGFAGLRKKIVKNMSRGVK